MAPPADDRPSTLRPFLQSTRTPFTVGRFQERATIFSQGDPGDSVMHIETGRVRLAVTSPAGQEAICGVLSTGAFLGEDVLDGHVTRGGTAIAMTATEVVVLAKDEMIRLLHTQAAFWDRFLAHVLARHNRLEADLADQLLHSSEERLARALIVLAGCDGRRPCGCELPHISQEIIAEMVGTTRSRVNRLMGKFRKRGFIESDEGGIRIKPSLTRVVDY